MCTKWHWINGGGFGIGPTRWSMGDFGNRRDHGSNHPDGGNGLDGGSHSDHSSVPFGNGIEGSPSSRRRPWDVKTTYACWQWQQWVGSRPWGRLRNES
uniref:Uncharacterized protein n=1 Tax=Romanomermis culicivorax TaxID=13658 RepID=A0A915IM68_ROMCU